MMIQADSLPRFGIVVCAVAMFAAGSANADFYSECAAAIERGDKETAQGLAPAMLEFRYIDSEAQRAAGIACLNFATGVEHEYSEMANAFRRAGDDARLRAEAAAEGAAKRAAEEAKRKQELERKAAEDSMAAEKVVREQEVWRRVADACGVVYADDPNTALTNRLCVDVFLEAGLPDD